MVLISYTSGSTVFTNAMWVTAGSPAVFELGAGWTEIGESAFNGVTTITSIHIPASVTAIGNFAFLDCATLTSVTFATGSGLLTIGSAAFESTAITSVIIPASVVSIGTKAFFQIAALTTVTFATGINLATIGSYVFSNSGITSIIIPASVTEIGDHMFYLCASLTTVTFAGSGLLTIGDRAFQQAALTSITIPASVTEIGDFAFYMCASLTTVTFAGNGLLTIGDHAFRSSAITAIAIPASVTHIGDRAFYQCASLTSVTFTGDSLLATITGTILFANSGLSTFTAPSSVLTLFGVTAGSGQTVSNKSGVTVTQVTTIIGYFSGSTAFTKSDWQAAPYSSPTVFEIGAGWTSIQSSAFHGVTTITSIHIPASVTIIEPAAFSEMTSLTSVTFATGSGLLTIDSGVFDQSAIASITIPASVTTIEAYAFQTTTSLATVTFAGDSQLATIGTSIFQSSSLSTFTAPSSVVALVGVTAGSNQTVSGKTGVTVIQSIPYTSGSTIFTTSAWTTAGSPTDVTLGEGWTSIGLQAFWNTALNSIILPASLTEIGASAFYDTALTSIIIPASVTSIGNNAFDSCANLTTVTFAGSGLESIGNYAFQSTALTSITIPASVTSIGNNAFQETAITSIIIPASVTAIGNFAFYNIATLTSVAFATGSGLLTIGSAAFRLTALASIAIPASVVAIGPQAFYEIAALTTVTFATGINLATIGSYVFSNSGITSIAIPASVTSIGDNAFESCTSLTTVTFAGIVLGTIGSSAFKQTAITSITIPASVTSIGDRAFQQTALTSIAIPASVTSIGDDAFNQAASLATVTFATGINLATIATSAFQSTAITSIIIPASVTSIGGNAFKSCSSLTSVTFATGIVLGTIGNMAFYGVAITSIEIPASVTSIGDSAFASTSLTSITIPASVTSIGDSAFNQAASLATVTFAGDSQLATIGTSIFQSSSLSTFTAPSSVVALVGVTAGSNQTVSGKTGVTVTQFIPYSSGSTIFTTSAWTTAGSPAVFELGEGWTEISSTAFLNNSGITSIAIPASVTSIGYSTFNQATNLTSVTFAAGSGLTIGNQAFYASGITSIAIPASVTSIGDSAFNKAASLATVTFAPNSTLATIGSGAFQESAITSIAIPASVTSIGNYAFYQCASLTTVTFGTGINLATISLSAFHLSALTSIEIPASVTSIGDHAFANTDLTSIAIPASVIDIGLQAFYNSASIATVTFDSNSVVETIGNQAFHAVAITSIEIPASVTSIGNNAFLFAASLASVTFLASTDWVNGISIGSDSAFSGTTALATIYLDNGQKISGTAITSPGTMSNFYGHSGSVTLVNTAPPEPIISAIGTGAFSWGAVLNATGDNTDGTVTVATTDVEDGQTVTITLNNAPYTNTVTNNASVITITAAGLQGLTDGSSYTLTADVSDVAGNAATQVTSSSFSVDITAPTLSSVSLVSDYSVNTNAGIGSKITLAFTTSEEIQSPTVAFKVGNATITGSINITNIGNVWSAVYYVGANHPSGALTYTIDYSDIAGNQGTQVATGLGAVTVDVTRPTFTSISIASNNSTTSLSKPGNYVTLTMTASKTIQSPTVVFTSGGAAVADTTPTIANTSGDTWTATYTTDIADTDGSVSFTITYTDIYGNAASAVATAVTDGTSVTFDKTLPTVSSFVMDDVALKNGETASVALTFSEAVPGFNSDSYVTIANGTMPTMTSNAENKVWTAVFTPTTALESVTNVLTLTSGYTDAAGNPTTHTAIQSANYAIDTKQPVIASVTPITFNGTTNVINRKPSFVFSSTEGGTITTSNATFSSTTTAVLGDNTIIFDLLADYTTHDAITIIVTDPAGNPSAALTVPSFTVDTTIETLDVITTVSNHATFINTLDAIGLNHTDKNVKFHPTTNPYASYIARITLPNGDFATLTDANKVSIKGVIIELYATELDIVAADTLFVDLIEGSFIADVYVMTPEAVSSNIQICFPKGTPVITNQGEMPIEDIIPGVHTIRGKKITAITCTQPNTEHIVLIKKHALGKNVPCASTQISNHHRVFYKGKMVKASDLVNMCEGVIKTPYNGETLYNVVMRKHDKMMINNLICETLHPDNVMARICAGDYTHREKVELCNMLKRIGKTSDYTAYNKFYASLK